MTSSFIYEDLVSHIDLLQEQMLQVEGILNSRWNDKKRKRDELKSRSFVFLDPYGNQIVRKYMDHQSISEIIKKYKEDYVPKYLQRWIRIGVNNKNIVSELNEHRMGAVVRDYIHGCRFFIYGNINIQISTRNNPYLRQFTLPVLLTDKMEKIKLQIKTFFGFTDLELRLHGKGEHTEGKMLKSDDTVMSCQLYQENYTIIAKVLNCKISHKSFMMNSDGLYQIFIKNLAGLTRTLRVYSSMKVSTLKLLIQQIEGIPPDQQCLRYSGSVLEGERSLGNYQMKKESTLHLVLRLRGGMYHFTSGRQDLNRLPYDGAKVIRNALAFQTKPMDQIHFLSSNELQNFLLEAQEMLANLYNTIGRDLGSSDDRE